MLWTKDVSELWQKDTVGVFFPQASMKNDDKANSIARLLLYNGIALSIVKKDVMILVLSVMCMYALSFTVEEDVEKIETPSVKSVMPVEDYYSDPKSNQLKERSQKLKSVTEIYKIDPFDSQYLDIYKEKGNLVKRTHNDHLK